MIDRRTVTRTGRGFTLVELLVVVAVIGLLIGVLLPALAGARRSAMYAANLSNHRQLSMALAMYGHEHERYPGHKPPKGWVHADTGRPNPRWQWAVGDYAEAPYRPRNDAEQLLLETSNDFPRLDSGIFIDPLHTYEDTRSLQTGNIQVLRNNSYGYNFHYLGNTRGGLDGGPVNYPVRFSSVRAPSGTVAFADSAGSQSVRLEHGYREHAYTLDGPRLHPNTDRWGDGPHQVPAAVRHLGKATTSLGDGSASAYTLAELGYDVIDPAAGTVHQGTGDMTMWTGRGYDPVTPEGVGDAG